jgi:hypothetical protein
MFVRSDLDIIRANVEHVNRAVIRPDVYLQSRINAHAI